MLEELKAYLSINYYTLDELCSNLSIDADNLIILVNNKCIPAHSYEITENVAVNSFFGEHSLPAKKILYFNKNVIPLIEKYLTINNPASLKVISKELEKEFFVRYKTKLEELGILKFRSELLDFKSSLMSTSFHSIKLSGDY